MRSKGFFSAVVSLGITRRANGTAAMPIGMLMRNTVPGEIVCENTAEGGPRGESNRAYHCENTKSKAKHFWRKTFDAEHESSRCDHRSADSLKHSCGKKPGKVRREAADG